MIFTSGTTGKPKGTIGTFFFPFCLLLQYSLRVCLCPRRFAPWVLLPGPPHLRTHLRSRLVSHARCTHLLPQPPSHLLRVSLVSWARIWFNRLPIFFLFLPWFCSFLAGGAAGIAKWTNHGVAWRLLRVCLAAREGRWRLGSSQIQQPFHGHLHAVSLRQQYFCYPSQMLHLDC